MKVGNMYLERAERTEHFQMFWLREFPIGVRMSYAATLAYRFHDKKWGVQVTHFYDSTHFGYVTEESKPIWRWFAHLPDAAVAAWDEYKTSMRILRYA